MTEQERKIKAVEEDLCWQVYNIEIFFDKLKEAAISYAYQRAEEQILELINQVDEQDEQPMAYQQKKDQPRAHRRKMNKRNNKKVKRNANQAMSNYAKRREDEQHNPEIKHKNSKKGVDPRKKVARANNCQKKAEKKHLST